MKRCPVVDKCPLYHYAIGGVGAREMQVGNTWEYLGESRCKTDIRAFKCQISQLWKLSEPGDSGHLRRVKLMTFILVEGPLQPEGFQSGCGDQHQHSWTPYYPFAEPKSFQMVQLKAMFDVLDKWPIVVTMATLEMKHKRRVCEAVNMFTS